jgi:hypothetical protein
MMVEMEWSWVVVGASLWALMGGGGEVVDTVGWVGFGRLDARQGDGDEAAE